MPPPRAVLVPYLASPLAAVNDIEESKVVDLDGLLSLDNLAQKSHPLYVDVRIIDDLMTTEYMNHLASPFNDPA